MMGFPITCRPVYDDDGRWMPILPKKFRANLNVNGNIQKSHVPSEISAINYAYNTTRALPAYDEDGRLCII